LSKNTKDKQIATLIVRGACDLHSKTRKAIADWLREQAQTIELQNHELAKTYSARFWRYK
jgi:hypothetical protein